MRANLVCPETGGPVSFEVDNDAKSVSRGWRASVRVTCPYCGGAHVAAFKDVYIDGVLTGFLEDFDRVLLGPGRRG